MNGRLQPQTTPMMLLALGSLLALLAGCGREPEARPLTEAALVGEWEVWCRTDKESTSTCLGKESDGIYKRFDPGGRVAVGARGQGGGESTGSWSLHGDVLTLVFSAGGFTSEERYRARITGGRLVLWKTPSGWGTVLGRTGARFEAASSKRSSAGRTTHSIGGVRYSIALPSGYRLARDDNDRQRWEKGSGKGLSVRLTVAPRSEELVDGRWQPVPCEGPSGTMTAGQEIDGVARVTAIGLELCLDGGMSLSCMSEHSRGWLEEADKRPALALCESLTLR